MKNLPFKTPTTSGVVDSAKQLGLIGVGALSHNYLTNRFPQLKTKQNLFIALAAFVLAGSSVKDGDEIGGALKGILTGMGVKTVIDLAAAFSQDVAPAAQAEGMKGTLAQHVYMALAPSAGTTSLGEQLSLLDRLQIERPAFLLEEPVTLEGAYEPWV